MSRAVIFQTLGTYGNLCSHFAAAYAAEGLDESACRQVVWQPNVQLVYADHAWREPGKQDVSWASVCALIVQDIASPRITTRAS